MSDAYYRSARRVAQIQILVGFVVLVATLVFVDWRLAAAFGGAYIMFAGTVQDLALARQQRREKAEAAELRRNAKVRF